MGHTEASISHASRAVRAAGLDESNALLAGLHELVNAATTGLETAAFLRKVVVVGARLTGSTHATVLLLDDDGTRIRARITLDHDNVAPLEMVAGPMMSKGLAGWVVRERCAAIVRDTEHDERWLPGPGLGDLRSALVVPLMYSSSMVGMLTLGHEMPEHYTEQDQLLAEVICAQAAGVVYQTGRTARADAPGPRPEKREIVVLSAAVRGLVEATGQVEGDVFVDEVLSTLYQAIDIVVARHGGAIDALTGCSVLAIFEGTTAALQAARAAFDLRLSVHTLSHRWRELHLALGGVDIGIAAGTALVGCTGFLAATRVVGVVVQDAVRLRELARGGETLVAAPIADTLRSDPDFAVQSLPPLRVEARALQQIFRIESSQKNAMQLVAGAHHSRW